MSASSQLDGLTLYEYVLTNNSTSTLNAEGLGLTVASDADLHSITGPTGWDILYFPGDTLVTWESSDISTYFIVPGASETFRFESALSAIPQPYLVTGLDITGTDFDFNLGEINSPGASAVPPSGVPEPATLASAGIAGLLALAVRSRRRRLSMAA